MLYPTHKRYGILSGILTIPFGISIGLIPTFINGFDSNTFVYAILGTYIGMKGALFGAEFPDCDSYGGIQRLPNGKLKKDENGNVIKSLGSIPSQKHPIISKTFKKFGVKHRGKFSHDFASQLVFWGAIYLVAILIGSLLINISITASPLVALIINITSIVGIWMVSLDMVDFINMIADFLDGKKTKKKKHLDTWEIDSKRIKKGILIFIVVAIIMIISGNLSLSTSNSSAIKTATLWNTLLKVYIIFTLAGVYSHLIADMMTKDGVHIFGKNLKPAKTLLRLKKLFFIFPLIFTIIGYIYYGLNGSIIGFILGCGVHFMLVSTDLKTGSKYEDLCRVIVTILCLPASLLAIKLIIGGS